MTGYRKIGIISDTHGLLRPKVVETLKGCEVIFHAGDVGKPEILNVLEQIAPVYAVRGNNDGWAFGAQERPVSQYQVQKLRHLPETLSVEFYGIRFFMIHDKENLPKEITDYDVILYGHSHKYEEQCHGSRLMLNPGSCGPKRFTLPVTMALMEISEDRNFHIKRIDLDGISAGTAKASSNRNSRSLLHRAKNTPDRKRTVRQVMKDTDKGMSVEKIADKRGISRELAEQICRLYLTHPGVDAEGILRKMGI